jgi:hypothetical protein
VAFIEVAAYRERVELLSCAEGNVDGPTNLPRAYARSFAGVQVHQLVLAILNFRQRSIQRSRSDASESAHEVSTKPAKSRAHVLLR